MGRFIPWREIYIFGSAAAALLGGAFSAPVTGAGLLIWWSVTIVFVFICIFIVVDRWFSPPDYITSQRVSVWSEIRDRNFVLPTLSDFDMLLDSFCEKTLEVLKSTPDLTNAERSITRDQLRKMLFGAKFLFTKRTSATHGLWRVRERGYALRRKLVVIRYTSPFTAAKILIALWHMIDLEILQRPPDPKRKNTYWWGALGDVRSRIVTKLLI